MTLPTLAIFSGFGPAANEDFPQVDAPPPPAPVKRPTLSSV